MPKMRKGKTMALAMYSVIKNGMIQNAVKIRLSTINLSDVIGKDC